MEELLGEILKAMKAQTKILKNIQMNMPSEVSLTTLELTLDEIKEMLENQRRGQ